MNFGDVVFPLPESRRREVGDLAFDRPGVDQILVRNLERSVLATALHLIDERIPNRVFVFGGLRTIRDAMPRPRLK